MIANEIIVITSDINNRNDNSKDGGAVMTSLISRVLFQTLFRVVNGREMERADIIQGQQ